MRYMHEISVIIINSISASKDFFVYLDIPLNMFKKILFFRYITFYKFGQICLNAVFRYLI